VDPLPPVLVVLLALEMLPLLLKAALNAAESVVSGIVVASSAVAAVILRLLLPLEIVVAAEPTVGRPLCRPTFDGAAVAASLVAVERFGLVGGGPTTPIRSARAEISGAFTVERPAFFNVTNEGAAS
jgi:hypothetical protein